METVPKQDFMKWFEEIVMLIILQLRACSFISYCAFSVLDVVDFVKAGYHMRRAWKMYEKCYKEIHGHDPQINGVIQKKKKVRYQLIK